jgi:hypothetical protein
MQFVSSNIDSDSGIIIKIISHAVRLTVQRYLDATPTIGGAPTEFSTVAAEMKKIADAYVVQSEAKETCMKATEKTAVRKEINAV